MASERRDSVLSAGDDTTANIEFTTAFGGSLRNVKPRRRPNVTRQHDHNVDFTIYEDNAVIEREKAKEKEKEREKQMAPPRRARSAISQPPQRPNHRVSFAPTDNVRPQRPDHRVSFAPADDVRPPQPPQRPTASRRLSQAPRRPVIKAEEPSEELGPLDENTALTINSTIMLKPARRGTIYIPNDDTTMPSMYMGIFSPIKDLDAKAASDRGQDGMEISGIAAQMARKRGPRRSMVAISPKRPPLHVTMRPVQELVLVQDRMGQGGGKENDPPGSHGASEKKFERSLSTAKRTSKPFDSVCLRVQQQTNVEARPSRLREPTATSSGRVVERKEMQRLVAKPGWNAGARLKTNQPVPVKIISPKSSPVVESAEQTFSRKPLVPNRFVVPNVKSNTITEDYPILTEDLATPALYEDSWLNHQEIAMTQLINNLFSLSSPTSPYIEDGMLRIQLLEKLGTAENAMLYKRLQGALLYGALSVPNDVLKGAGRLSTDLGKRRAFTDLWLDTYDISCLPPALEAVVGRQCGKGVGGSPATRRSLDRKHEANRRSLQRFIETFLIRNEDGAPDASSTDRGAWSFQRTLLRSLMLIKLLDMTKVSSTLLVSPCLFQPSSAHKSSVSVVQGLFQLLNPSAGDPVRALSHVGYSVGHSQYPLEEYEYKIDNLAVDLRDGVRLTRLVELLLYPSASQFLEHGHDADATTTVLLPTGELLSLTDGQRDWPLSQHLKFPCLGRATKLYNVQIALSALQGVKGMTALVRDVQAEDIVDGYREKTVKILWGLTSKWGLGGLVNWGEVEREIKRLCRTNSTHDNEYFEMLDDEEGPARYKVLLKSWAQAIANKTGLVVTNLTTSFADGRAFEAIVDEYEGYIGSEAGAGKSRPLRERLRNLGCSEQFSQLFSPSAGSIPRGHIFDRDFVLAALAFLCSRLLAPSKAARAAVTLQRAWRLHRSRMFDSRKRCLKMVAEQCAEAVWAKKRPFAQQTEEDDIWLNL